MKLSWSPRNSELARNPLGASVAILVTLVLLAPLMAMVGLSFMRQDGFALDTSFTLANYRSLIEPSDTATVWMGIPFYLKNPVPLILLIKSIFMSLIATLGVILAAYPMAYFLAFRVKRYKVMWLILITIPFWTSYLLRVFAWKIVLGFNGAINSGLKSIGLIDQPLEFLLYNPVAVMLTLTHAWVAFAILPIYVSLEKIDRSLLEAATDLGDSRWRRFRRVTLPLSMPGVVSAALLVFIPTVGDYVTPTLVGGPGGIMIGNAIQTLFFKQNDTPMGATIAIVMMLVVAAVVLLFLWAIGYRKMMQRGLRT
ncbi:ABC transporter permease [Rhizobium alvei]|uniref:ABC transporter permease n=1 Tax=Rhizobium alvei TaxID=1132659 RepID=A0ABT8YP29_9HYPH|nr:ABC transporter permease [Rhizobium alvei]MDO6965475.1 ABC transporter permease [Rhizobium alvei]